MKGSYIKTLPQGQGYELQWSGANKKLARKGFQWLLEQLGGYQIRRYSLGPEVRAVKVPGSKKVIKCKSGTQIIDRCWKFLKERLNINQHTRVGSQFLKLQLRSAQYEYWRRGQDLWIDTGVLVQWFLAPTDKSLLVNAAKRCLLPHLPCNKLNQTLLQRYLSASRHAASASLTFTRTFTTYYLSADWHASSESFLSIPTLALEGGASIVSM